MRYFRYFPLWPQSLEKNLYCLLGRSKRTVNRIIMSRAISERRELREAHSNQEPIFSGRIAHLWIVIIYVLIFYLLIWINWIDGIVRIKIQVFCSIWIFQHNRGYARGQRAPQQPPWHWKKHIGRGQSLWDVDEGLQFWLSRSRHQKSSWKNAYDLSSVVFVDVNDVSEGGNNIDVDAAEWRKSYPSSETVFWKDIQLIYDYH